MTLLTTALLAVSVLFNDGWEFAKDGKSFRAVELPHDWAIEGPFDPDLPSGTGKLPWKGEGVYRHTLNCTTNELEECAEGALIALDFDGVMARARVLVNGNAVALNEYGYLGFRAELMDFLVPGENEILVQVDTLDHVSRWYPGAGIYRRVFLAREPKLRVDRDSLYVTTPKVGAETATVEVQLDVKNGSRFASKPGKVLIEVVGPDGKTAAKRSFGLKAIEPFGTAPAKAALNVAKPRLWEPVDPAALYTVRATVEADGVKDTRETRFGIRTAEFTVEDGFHLNGRRVDLRGVCLHSDLGILGMAVDRSVLKRQLKRMRSMGVNAIRTSHNCPAPELLELCDEMGLMVWDECFDKWDGTAGRTKATPLEPYITKYLRAFVRRDRNHPSVVVWSIGNEIESWEPHTSNREIPKWPRVEGTTAKRCTLFRNICREEDASRQVGIASCEYIDINAVRGDLDMLDVVGFNYAGKYQLWRKIRPHQAVVCSESASCVSSYGCYTAATVTNRVDFRGIIAAKEVDSMDRNSAPWGDPPDKEFERMDRDKYCAGEFVWTGTDYLGEPWPVCPTDGWLKEVDEAVPPRECARSAYFGVCDLLHLPKDRYYLYRSHWAPELPTCHIAPDHWNFPDQVGKKRLVYVYSNADEVELFVNGKSYGRKKLDPTAKSEPDNWWNFHDATFADGSFYDVFRKYRFIFDEVVYEPGEIKAVAYKDGRRYLEETLKTAGEPRGVKLMVEEDTVKEGGLVFVEVGLVDEQGVRVPDRSDEIRFALEGDGKIVAVGNGDPRGLKSFKAVASHPLYHGRAGLFIRRTGKVKLTASAAGLAPAIAEF